MNGNDFRKRWINYILDLQDHICTALEQVNDGTKFLVEEWQRTPGGNEGGGNTRVMINGPTFEKGGVNTSVVHGKVTDEMRKQLGMQSENWFACGLSLVIHPLNPFVPAVHANWRYLELSNKEGTLTDQWFGGGADLTPYYLFEEDARHFHQTLRKAITPFGKDLYPKYKKQCDLYFNNTHRGFEARGIGGVFYDYLRPSPDMDLEKLFAFQQANGNCFIEAYLPLVEKRKNRKWKKENKHWQEIRRGRYVEFNLIHDRGTLFGLKTKGRTESILMSLPPTVRFEYNYQPEKGSEEEKLLKVCQQPIDWI